MQISLTTFILGTVHIYLCFTRSYPLASFSLLSYALLIYFSGSSKNVSSSTKVIYDIVNIGLHFILKNVRPYAAPLQ